ncbi:MAG: DUF805 domain-containing protein [Pseudomonadota bacterium]
MNMRDIAQLLVDPRGRINRKGLLAVAVPLVFTQLALYAMFGVYGLNAHNSWMVFCCELVFVAMALVLAAKRLHDCDMSAWWIPGALAIVVALISLCSFAFLYTLGAASLQHGHIGYVVTVGANVALMLVALLWLHCKQGTPGDNRFGPAPDGFGVSHPDDAMRQDLPTSTQPIADPA